MLTNFSKVSSDFHFLHHLHQTFCTLLGCRLYLATILTYESDTSLDASWNGEWYRLENFPIRSIFHREKRGKRNIQNFTRTVFHVGKWNGTENLLAYVTVIFKTRLTIYRSPLYVNMDARYKRKTDHVENGTLWFIAYISHPFSHTEESNISLDASWKGECHRLENFPVRSIFHH